VSEAFTAEEIEAGRYLFAQAVDFVKGAVSLSTLPPADRTEIAFAGRSNVGKSSLINALLNRKGLARASNTPGRTRELNYFDLTGKMYVVDLPGYGHAKAPKTEIARWTKLTRDYLRGRATLVRVFLLIDARRGLMKTDGEIMDMLDESAVVYQIILTKADKASGKERAAALEGLEKALKKRPAAHPVIRETSAEKGTGIPELRAEIAGLVG
jgi:GTP-binding protein